LVRVGVLVIPEVGVRVGVTLGVLVRVGVLVMPEVGVRVAVSVDVRVAVGVDVRVAVGENVRVGVLVGCAAGSKPEEPSFAGGLLGRLTIGRAESAGAGARKMPNPTASIATTQHRHHFVTCVILPSPYNYPSQCAPNSAGLITSP